MGLRIAWHGRAWPCCCNENQMLINRFETDKGFFFFYFCCAQCDFQLFVRLADRQSIRPMCGVCDVCATIEESSIHIVAFVLGVFRWHRANNALTHFKNIKIKSLKFFHHVQVVNIKFLMYARQILNRRVTFAATRMWDNDGTDDVQLVKYLVIEHTHTHGLTDTRTTANGPHVAAKKNWIAVIFFRGRVHVPFN